MTTTQLLNQRKRQNAEHQPPPRSETCQRHSKRTKRSHDNEPHFPPAFWENLSRIELTHRALKELDRRNNQGAPDFHRIPPTLHRPITRGVLGHVEKSPTTAFPSSFLCHHGQKSLKDLKWFARFGGPDLSDLRAFPEPVDPPHRTTSSNRLQSSGRKLDSQSLSTSRSTSITPATKSTGPYNRNFQQNLIDGGVYPHGYKFPDGRVPKKPDNWVELSRRLVLPRRSLSPSKFSDKEHEKFVQADGDAVKEEQVTTSVIPTIEGNIGDSKCVSGGIEFANLHHLTDGTIAPGNPDIYYGARPEQLDRRVRDELSSYIIPSAQDGLPIAPNFFLAVKGPAGSLSVAAKQASYNGALGERGILSLLSDGQEEPVFDNNAHTISSIYHGGQLKLYTIHGIPPTNPESRPAYFMHQLRSFAMADTAETFRQGATAYRNARDWAKEQRDVAIPLSNGRVNDSQRTELAVEAGFEQVNSFTNEPALDEADTTETLSQESRISLSHDSNTTIGLQGSESLSDLLSRNSRPAKRLNRHSWQHSPPQRKRHNAAGS
ncbi:uncharacterized protein Z520_12258 [Fonsecaea multimorphosa CBS 102226]|uniref:Uncharacterized protein n=1 Tax=Fonsecaea multimorphosa CBS 102226 TaxID=1442371 RepID=A0A0D2JFV0_9EURO|nr:uncharacterized protein Z520_12258 [Fonsecaea multimorphosa CBS 102226]KIX92042.1 hypothetical protein Z520_12258 [Fonsecaea multimorphosa CBS 102226]OAL17410.1 hypothetical protein AYO22_11691 [Fonsecaea multimorphosa]